MKYSFALIPLVITSALAGLEDAKYSVSHGRGTLRDDFRSPRHSFRQFFRTRTSIRASYAAYWSFLGAG